MPNLTQAQHDRLAIFRFTYPDDVFQIGNTIDVLTAQIADATVVDGAYVNEMLDLLDLQTARLITVKAPAHGGDDVIYGGGHPREGGTDPTDWQVVATGQLWATPTPLVLDETLGPFVVKSQNLVTTYVEGVNYTESLNTPDADSTTLTWITPAVATVHVAYGGPPVEAYSHDLNWDDDQSLLDLEASWTDMYNSRHNQYFGTIAQLAGLNTSLTVQNQQLDLVEGREFAAIRTGTIGRYISWATADSVLTRQTAILVTRIDNAVVLVQGVDYTFEPVESFAGYFTIQVFVDDEGVPVEIPALVKVTANG
jgi:hypothetical protein